MSRFASLMGANEIRLASQARSRMSAWRKNGVYEMKAQGDTAEIFFYDVIGETWDGGITSKQFAQDLRALGDVKQLNLRFNSPGGDVFEGIAIYTLLNQHPAQKMTFVDGMAASIASVIAMASDHITIAESAFFMIHKPWSWMVGDATDMRALADLLDKIQLSSVEMYSARTGLPAEDVDVLVNAETWMTGKEAVEKGFADAVTPNKTGKSAESSFDLSHFKNAPRIIAPEPPADPVPAPSLELYTRRLALYERMAN